MYILQQWFIQNLNIPFQLYKIESIYTMQGQPKHYLFETQTKRLKEFYSKNINELLSRRIIFNNSLGTVRYVGQLQHEGKPANSVGQIWVGLEWDENGRGKHNGEVNGFKYFECPQKKGSLVKFEKIQFGYKLETALFKRYFRVEELHHAKDIYESLKAYKQQFKDHSEEEKNKKCEQMVKKIHKTEYDSEAYVETLNEKRKIMVEFIGFDEIWTKLNNLEKLHSISLAECRICDLGPKGHLQGILTNLKVLSLQDNLISSWNQVFQLGAQLKNLRQLSLTNNKIAKPLKSVSQLQSFDIIDQSSAYKLEEGHKIFESLQCLILMNTGLTWKTLFMVSEAFDRTIQELILCKNDMSDIENINEEKIKKMPKLTFLNVEETNQNLFSGIMKFGCLDSLEKLIINKNPIQEIGKVEGFTNLKHLSVQYCDIQDAVVINQISHFRELESLNIKHNPVGERMGNSHIRMRSVAEVQKLKIINGSQLRKYQRKDCEIYYMRESFKQYFTLKNVPDYDYDFEDFMKYCEVHHPGIQYFIKRYGNPYEVQHKKEIKEIVKDQVKQVEMKKGTGMIEVTLKNNITKFEEKKKVPLTWSVNTLMNFFAKVYKIPVAIQVITYKLDAKQAQQEMSQTHKPLSHYNLYNGSIIIVDRSA